MAKRRKKWLKLEKVKPHKGPVILGKPATILPQSLPPEAALQLLAELQRTKEEIRRAMMLPARMLNGR